MRKRRRSRNGVNKSPIAFKLILLSGFAVLLLLLVSTSVSFTTGELDREVGLEVGDDTDSFIGLDFSETIETRTENELLVIITNNNNQIMEEVTISSPDDDISFCDSNDCSQEDITFNNIGASQSVEVEVEADVPPGQVDGRTVPVNIQATSGDTSIDLSREETQITSDGTGGGSQDGVTVLFDRSGNSANVDMDYTADMDENIESITFESEIRGDTVIADEDDIDGSFAEGSERIEAENDEDEVVTVTVEFEGDFDPVIVEFDDVA